MLSRADKLDVTIFSHGFASRRADATFHFKDNYRYVAYDKCEKCTTQCRSSEDSARGRARRGSNRLICSVSITAAGRRFAWQQLHHGRNAARRAAAYLALASASAPSRPASLIKQRTARARVLHRVLRPSGRINGGVNVPAFAVGRMDRGRTDGRNSWGDA